MGMKQTEAKFKDEVYKLVGEIPAGKVMTYGQIAALCGKPNAARIVGQVAHFGPTDLPWQRVVKKSGDLAAGFPGGREGHRAMLQADGVKVNANYTIDVDSLLYWPS